MILYIPMSPGGLDFLFLKLNLKFSFNNLVWSLAFISKPFELAYYILLIFSTNSTVCFSKFLEFIICASFLESGQFVCSVYFVDRRFLIWSGETAQQLRLVAALPEGSTHTGWVTATFNDSSRGSGTFLTSEGTQLHVKQWNFFV